MKRATSHDFADHRNPAAWRSRGLLALYAFGVASLIAAVVTFIAHNWTYLGTGMKLGGLGAALMTSAAIWVIKGFDRPNAQSFGIATQILIGVWLAAAGQIYQAPGGLQGLLLVWAVLGLLFALASRSPAHWAVWFGIIWLTAISPTGLRLLGIIGPDWHAAIVLIGAMIIAVGVMIALYKSTPIWLSALLMVGVGSLTIWASWLGLFEPNGLGQYGPSLIALTLLGALGWRSYSMKIASTTAIVASAIAIVVVSLFGELFSNVFDDAILYFLIMTGLVCAATYALVVFFKHLRAFIDAEASDAEEIDANPWYMDALIGAGGVLTACFACGLIAAVIGLSGLLEQNWGLSFSVIGGGVYALSIVMRRMRSGQFTRFLFGTFILVGMGCLSIGLGGLIGDPRRETMVAGLALLSLSILTAWIVSGDRILSTLMTVSTCIAIALVFTEIMDSRWSAAALMSLYTAFGLIFGTVLLRHRLHLGSVAICFIAAILTGLTATFDLGQLADMDWTLIDVASGACGAVGGLWLWKSYCRTTGPSWPVLTALILIAVILPLGAVPAMLLLILAYAVGSRALFLIGVIAMGWFLFSAYFDLSMTLMALSGVMAAAGAGLLGLWAFASKRVEIAS